MFEFLTCTIFDSRASQSFAFTTFAHIYNLIIEPLQQFLVVELPIGGVVVYSNVALGCLLVLSGSMSKTDLVIFNLLGFNIILGMNCQV